MAFCIFICYTGVHLIMKYLVAVVSLLLSVSIKAESLQNSLLWEKVRFYNGIVLLQRNKPDLKFSIFDPSSMAFYSVNSMVLDKEIKIRSVDFIRDQSYLKVEVESNSEKRTTNSGVIDLKGNWIIKPIDFSVSEMVPGFVIGYSPAGNIDVKNFNDELVKSIPREWRCSIKRFENSFIFPCENPKKIIHLDIKNQSKLFTEINYSGIFLKAVAEGKLFVFNNENKTILFSEQKGKLYEFPQAYDIAFLTDKIFALVTRHTGTYEKFYQLDKGELKLKTGIVHGIEQYGNTCLRWRATVNDVASTRILDNQAQWHDVSEDLADLCDLKPEIPEAPKSDAINLRVVYTDDKRCGYQNKNNEWQIEPIYSSCREFVAQGGVVKLEGVWGIIDRNGEWLTEKPAKRSFIVQEWEARSLYGRNAGVIDNKGQWVIPPMLDEDNSFLSKDGVLTCAFKSVSGCYRLDFSGNLEKVTDQEVNAFKPVTHHEAKYSLVEEDPKPMAVDGAWGYRKASGEWLVEPKYADAEHFFNGVAAVAMLDENQQKLWGLVDETGREVAKPKYEEIYKFHKDISWYKNYSSNWWGLLNRSGKELTKTKFSRVNPIKSDLTVAYIDTDASSFSSRRAVLINSKGEIIDIEGDVPEYVDVFMDGATYAKAGAEGSWGFIDRNGKWLDNYRFDSASSFVGNHAFASVREYDNYRGRMKNVWQVPQEEQSTYIITNIAQIESFPIFTVDILQSTEKFTALFDARTSSWIRTGLTD